jgi:hypothetical protein
VAKPKVSDFKINLPSPSRVWRSGLPCLRAAVRSKCKWGSESGSQWHPTASALPFTGRVESGSGRQGTPLLACHPEPDSWHSTELLAVTASDRTLDREQGWASEAWLLILAVPKLASLDIGLNWLCSCKGPEVPFS